MGWGHGMGWGGGWMGAIFGLAVLASAAVVVGLVVLWIVRKARDGNGQVGTASDPLDIARRRLASGEISVEEFERIRRTLRGES